MQKPSEVSYLMAAKTVWHSGQSLVGSCPGVIQSYEASCPMKDMNVLIKNCQKTGCNRSILSNAIDDNKEMGIIINDELDSWKKENYFTVKEEPSMPDPILNAFKQESLMENRAQEFCNTISGILNDGGERIFDDNCIEEKNDIIERQLTYKGSFHKKKLKKRLTIHAGERKYECKHCHKKFLQNSNLRTHLTIHTGEKKYECEHCHRKFAQNITLKKHLVIHTGEKKYECEHCHKKFSLNTTLKRHLMIHTGE